ncbi:uncharacterized protein BDR25DRAFT_377005, partial [Lindgomyces ingoldianus]
SNPEREPPIIVTASSPPEGPTNPAAFIFIYGLGDDGVGLENVPGQFRSVSKLSHLSWILPNALENHETIQTAWYIPTALSSYPSSCLELEDEGDDAGMKSSIAYLVSLIDDLVAKRVPEKSVVLGGFS